MSPVSETLLIFAAGAAAGTINSVAGGGTLLSFPVLLWLGRDPIVANVSNTVALWPGSLASAYAFRRELASAPRLLAVLLPPSLLGALAGAWLLLATPTRFFSALVPILILVATALVALRRPLLRLFAGVWKAPSRKGAAPSPAAASPRRPLPGGERRSEAEAEAPSAGEGAPLPRDPRAPAPPHPHVFALALGQLAVGIYGGYFGAAMGIMMLAALGLASVGDIHQRNALKNAISAAINALAAVFFAVRGAVDWSDAMVLGLGAVTGGYLGGVVGRRLDARVAEAVVVGVGLLAALVQMLRVWGR